MRKSHLTAVLALAVLALAAPAAEAQTYRYARGYRYQPAYYYTYQQPAAYQYQQPAAYQQPAVYQAQQPASGDYAGALAVINGARARHGLHPLAWSAQLASWAAANVANQRYPHQVMAPGAGQCVAFVSDPVQAAYQWLGSAAHWGILSSAVSEIGISACPGGLTCNAR